MGFLKVYGKVLKYKNAEKERKIVREHALEYICTWSLETSKVIDGLTIEAIDPDDKVDLSKFEKQEPLFGYECEIHKVTIDDKHKTVKIDLSGEYDIYNHTKIKDSKYTYQPEYGKWMIEGIN